LAGVTNVVGFSASKRQDAPGRFSGKILDDSGATVTEFKSSQNGEGQFSFEPQAGKEYKAVIIDSLQNVSFATLSPAVKEGLSMHISDAGDSYEVTVNNRLNGKETPIYLVVHHKASPLLESEIKFVNGRSVSTFSKSILPPGFSQVSAFNAAHEILASRMVSQRKSGENMLAVRVNQSNYKTRERVILNLKMKDSIATARLSISVRALEPTGVKPKPADYLYSEDGAQTVGITDEAALSLRGAFYLLSDMKGPKFLAEVRGNLITGTVTDNQNQQPKVREIVYLSIPARNYLFYAARTDSTGRFFFNTEGIPPASELVFTLNPATCAECKVNMEMDGLKDYSEFIPGDLTVDSTLRKVIERRSVQSQIENAYYLEKQDSIASIAREPFYGRPDKAYLLDDFVRFPTMEDIFIEYVVEAILRKKGDQFELKAMNFITRTAFEGDPLILLDGVPMFNTAQIMNYNPLLLQKIEIVGRRYFYGPLEVQGIISLSTYGGDVKNISLPERVKFTGVQPPKVYYSPKYNSPALDKIPDYRTQLYWNPDVVVSDHAVTVDFFTSDVTGDFEIVAEGIQTDGTPVYFRNVIHVGK
jgi:hypothetical protein